MPTEGYDPTVIFTATTPGTVPPSGGDADEFLSADGTFKVPAGGGGPATQLDAAGDILDIDAIADGEVLVRSGDTIVGGTASGLNQAQVLARGCGA